MAVVRNNDPAGLLFVKMGQLGGKPRGHTPAFPKEGVLPSLYPHGHSRRSRT